MRVWLKRLVLAGIGAAALYLAGANLVLNTPLGPRLVNRRPERATVTWRRAWSLWPGDLRIAGLTVEVHGRRVGWRVTVDRGRARIDLPALFVRRFHVLWFAGSGAASRTWAEPAAEAGPRRPSPAHPWTLRFDRVALSDLREIGHGELRLMGEGRAEAAFTRVLGGEFALSAGSLELSSGRLLLGEQEFGRDLRLAADLTVAPYAPREHPGVAGLDFLSGTLALEGAVTGLPFLARLQGAGAPAPEAAAPDEAGELTADLRLQAGEVAPGSRLALRTPSPPAGQPCTATLAVEAAEPPRLTLAFDAPGFTIPRRGGGPPWLTAEELEVTAATGERRLSRLLAATATSGAPFPGDSPGEPSAESIGEFTGYFKAGGLALATGRRLLWNLGVDRATGRIGLAALLRREVRLDRVRAAGVTSVMTAPEAGASPPAAAGAAERRWAVELTDAEFEGIRTIAVGGSSIAGAGTAAGGLRYAADGSFEVPAATIEIPRGRLLVAGREAARDLDLRLTGRLAPFTPGTLAGAAALRPFSGVLAVRGRVDSLGFLSHYLDKTPWLALAGRGALTAEVHVESGRLLPGSRFSIPAAQVEATILDDVATGTAAVSGRVAGGPSGPRATLTVVFGRFSLAPVAPAGTKGGARAYLRGSGLRLDASTTSLDLAAPATDLRAEVDLADSEVPDLTLYNAYFPDSAGLAIVGGSGRLRLHLRLDAASDSARGEVNLTSDGLRLRFKDLELAGRLSLDTRLASSELRGRRFALDGTRLDLDEVSFHDSADDDSPAAAAAGWWGHFAVTDGDMVWSRPLALSGAVTVEMKDADLLLSVFAQRKRYLRWFADVLELEGLTAEGRVRLAANAVELDPFAASSGKLSLRSRLRFTKGSQRGDLLVRYGVLAVGIELRDGERDFKLIRPTRWFESRTGFDADPPGDGKGGGAPLGRERPGGGAPLPP